MGTAKVLDIPSNIGSTEDKTDSSARREKYSSFPNEQTNIVNQTKELSRLARSRTIFIGNLESALKEITEAAARGLGVERVGVWLFNAQHTSIRCMNQYERGKNSHSCGAELLAADYPAYFEALKEPRVIPAHDAHSDPRTREFSDSYLRPLGISSMLDAPIWVEGQMAGVICHEQVGQKREWSTEEQQFAGSMADFVCLAIEAQERMKAEAEKLKLEAQVRHAQKLESLGIMAGGIAHDFNNLLVGILGNVGLALEDLDPTSPAWHRIRKADEAGRRAVELTHQLLAYAGKSKFIISRVNLSQVIDEMAELLNTSIKKKVELKFDLCRNLPQLEADETQLRQIVMNLVINASDAIGEAHGAIHVCTGIEMVCVADLKGAFAGEALAEGDYVFLKVSDTGCGMSADTIGKIYDPFFTTKFTGRGLGLAAVSGIVRAHKGAIKAVSVPGQGSSFVVWLPYTCTEGVKAKAAPSIRVNELSKWQGQGTILVIDDESVVRAVAKGILEKRGFTILSANGGREGVRLFQEHKQEIIAVVLDLTMPDLSGEEVFDEIRGIRGDIPVVFSSGYSKQEISPRLSADRRCSFIQKPYLPTGLIACLHSVLPQGG